MKIISINLFILIHLSLFNLYLPQFLFKSYNPKREEKLSGIVFYEEVRDFILKELRKFKSPYVTGTEVVYPTEEPVPKMEGLDDEILITLREIRDILRNRRKDKP